MAVAVGEDEPQLSLGALQLPFPQGLESVRPIGTVTLPRVDFGLPIRCPNVGPLPHMQPRFPRSTSFHRSPRNSDARKPAKIAVRRNGRRRLPLADDGLDLVRGRNIDAHLSLRLPRLSGVIETSAPRSEPRCLAASRRAATI